MNDNHEQFAQRLDEHHQWPCPYTFKFIVPTQNLEKLTEVFPDQQLSFRESKNGKFTSVTMESTMCSSKEVMDIYQKAAQVPGVMSL